MSQHFLSDDLQLFPSGESPQTSDKLSHCPRCENIFLYNIETGECHSGSCNTYSCPYCGYRKARRLQNALEDYFKGFRFVRFWTFTIRLQAVSDLDNDSRIRFASE